MSDLDKFALVFGCAAAGAVVSALYGPAFAWIGFGLYAILRRFEPARPRLHLIPGEKSARLAEPAGRRNRSISS